MEVLLLLIDTIAFTCVCLWLMRKEAPRPPRQPNKLLALCDFRLGPAEIAGRAGPRGRPARRR